MRWKLHTLHTESAENHIIAEQIRSQPNLSHCNAAILDLSLLCCFHDIYKSLVTALIVKILNMVLYFYRHFENFVRRWTRRCMYVRVVAPHFREHGARQEVDTYIKAFRFSMWTVSTNQLKPPNWRETVPLITRMLVSFVWAWKLSTVLQKRMRLSKLKLIVIVR